MARLVPVLLATCLAPVLGNRVKVGQAAPGETISVKEHVKAIEERNFTFLKDIEYKNTIGGQQIDAKGELPDDFDPDAESTNESHVADGNYDKTLLRDAFADLEGAEDGEDVLAKLCGRCCCDMPSTKSYRQDRTVIRSDRCGIFYLGIARDKQFARLKCGSFQNPSWSSNKPMHNFKDSKPQKENVFGAGKCIVPQEEIDNMHRLTDIIDHHGDRTGILELGAIDRCNRKFNLIAAANI